MDPTQVSVYSTQCKLSQVRIRTNFTLNGPGVSGTVVVSFKPRWRGLILRQ